MGDFIDNPCALFLCSSRHDPSPCCLLPIQGPFIHVIQNIQERSWGASLCLCARAIARVRSCTMPMSPPTSGHHQPEDQPVSLLHLPLAGQLPDNQKLVINPTARTVILFAQTSPGEADIVTVQQFSPNGMRVLIPLLEAYPNYCPYETLLAHLFSLTLD